ncbi:hypothetical protein R6Q59_000265 [Mikania micrantha]
MVKAIRIHEHGGPEVMKLEDVELGELKTGEIKVKNIAIGVNFLDIYMRSSENYATPLPYTPGFLLIPHLQLSQSKLNLKRFSS